MKVTTAHQPAYLPWLGYIHKIALSDTFVLLDQVQFEKNSFTNRNKIWSPNGPIMLTVPVLSKGHTSKDLSELETNNLEKWQEKHFKSICMSYRKAPFFGRYSDWLEMVYSTLSPRLIDITDMMLGFILSELKISTNIVRQSSLSINSHKQDLVLELCKRTGADIYISGVMGKDYIDCKPFTDQRIGVYFQDYKHPVYEQVRKGEFIPNLGVIDLLMCVGPDNAMEIIFSGNHRRGDLVDNLANNTTSNVEGI